LRWRREKKEGVEKLSLKLYNFARPIHALAHKGWGDASDTAVKG